MCRTVSLLVDGTRRWAALRNCGLMQRLTRIHMGMGPTPLQKQVTLRSGRSVGNATLRTVRCDTARDSGFSPFAAISIGYLRCHYSSSLRSLEKRTVFVAFMCTAFCRGVIECARQNVTPNQVLTAHGRNGGLRVMAVSLAGAVKHSLRETGGVKLRIC